MVYNKQRMPDCEKCKKCFRDAWNLNKHMSRIRPCKTIVQNPKDTLVNPKDTSDNPKDTSGNPKDTSANPKDTLVNPKDTSGNPKDTMCEWCLKTFYNCANKNKHLKICKMVNDPVRILEMELKITPCINSECCRFCKKQFSRKAILNKHNCQDKIEYLKELNKTNKITINNNTINIFINEQNIDIESIVDQLRKLNKMYGDDSYTKAGNLVLFLDEQMSQEQSNINVFIPNAKSLTGMILTSNGWELNPAEEILDIKFKSTATKLVSLKPDIDKHNPKVFQQSNNRLTFIEAAEIGKHGWRHGVGTIAKRELKTKFKVNTIKRSKIVENKIKMIKSTTTT